MKVGFAARWSPLDKKSWSGTSYYTYQENKKYNEILFDKKTGRYKNLENVEYIKKQPLSINFIANYQDFFISKLNEDQVAKIDFDVKPLGVLQFIKFKIQ